MGEPWTILIHGGAKTIEDDRRQANRAGCLEAVNAGASVLRQGGSAVDAVVAAIVALENDPTFNAGYGSVLNSDGAVECDAAIMDGATLDVGAVAAIQGVRNPITVARALLRDSAVLLAGEGAARYAAETGLEFCAPNDLVAQDTIADEACDTVGCVAFDQHGQLAAGTSTGGLSGVRPGRVGDSPLPGCGLAAEHDVGAVSFSGDGESIVRLTLAARLMSDLPKGSAREAAQQAIAQLHRVGGEAGCIVLDAAGNPAIAHNSENFAVAIASRDQPAAAYLHQDEFYHD